MYGTTEQVIREHYEDLRREAARVRPAPMDREDHEARPYVVRDLSWELARLLETQDYPESASVTADSAGGCPRWTPVKERLAG
jgi:hypothetical protein